MSAPKHKRDAYRPSDAWKARRRDAVMNYNLLSPEEKAEMDKIIQNLEDEFSGLGKTGALELIQALAEKMWECEWPLT